MTAATAQQTTQRQGGLGLAVLALVALLAACDDAPPPAKPADKSKAAAEATAEQQPQAALPEGVLGENPKWKPVQALFEAYTATEVGALTDFTLDNTTLFIERPAVQEEPEVDGQTDEAVAAVEIDPKNCATRSGIDAYRLVLLMTARSQPKAMVVDASNEDCVVLRGDALGNEGGRVTAITQYEVVVLVPGREQPVKLSIAPPLSLGDEGSSDAAEGP